MKREKLDATCPAGWYEFDLAVFGNRRVCWWDGSDLYGNKECTCRIGDRYSNFIGPLVEATGTTPPLQANEQEHEETLKERDKAEAEARMKELEDTIHELCGLANIARESYPKEYEGPVDHSLEGRVARFKRYLTKLAAGEREHEETLKERDKAETRVKELEDQLHSACEEIKAEQERSQAVHSWCSIDEANKWPEGSHVLECVLRDNGTVFEYRATTIWKPNRGRGHSRPSCYALIKAPNAIAVQYGGLAESRVKELTEETQEYETHVQELDKTICELEMDLDAARKRCHNAETTIEKLSEQIRHATGALETCYIPANPGSGAPLSVLATWAGNEIAELRKKIRNAESHAESPDRLAVHTWSAAWLAARSLYLVTGAAYGQRDVKLYVLAIDAGHAEAKARETWRSWKYSHDPIETKLVGKASQYGPEGVVTVVG